VTMRTKVEWVLEKDSNGRTMPKKIGTAAVQREGVEYEFDLVGEIDAEHRMVVTKSRFLALSDRSFDKADEGVGLLIAESLKGEAPFVAASEPSTPAQSSATTEDGVNRATPGALSDTLIRNLIVQADKSGHREHMLVDYVKSLGFDKIASIPMTEYAGILRRVSSKEPLVNSAAN
jgi:hypothetical protein